VLTWNTDATDMDLWIIEPDGTKIYYQNKKSKFGGILSTDFTGGYGPEEYVIKNIEKGKYAIKVNYFGNSSSKLDTAVTLKVDVYKNYGRNNESHKIFIKTLDTKSKVIDIH